MCGCAKITSIPTIGNQNRSTVKVGSEDGFCDISNVDIKVDIIEVAHGNGVIPYLDQVEVDTKGFPLVSIVLHIGGQVNIDVTDYELKPDGMLVFNDFDGQRNVVFDPMEDKMILSIVIKDKESELNCIKNIYP